MWEILSISCLLLSLQLELVEYWKDIKSLFFMKKIFKFHKLIFQFFPLISKSKHGFNSLILIRIMFLAFFSFVIIFLTCELGEMVYDSFDEFNNALNQCNWYLFPIEVRRIFALMITNAQQPVTIRGYGNTRCVREYFKQVISIDCTFYRKTIYGILIFFMCQIIRTSFSYFMAMHRIYR